MWGGHNVISDMDDRPGGSQCPQLKEHNWKKDQLLAAIEILWNLFLQMDPYKSMEPNGVHLGILKELAAVIAKPLLVIFGQSWQSGEVPTDWKLVTVPVFKRAKRRSLETTDLLVSPPSLVPGKVMDKIILEGIEKQLEDNTVIGYNQQSFMREKSCLTKLISF